MKRIAYPWTEIVYERNIATATTGVDRASCRELYTDGQYCGNAAIYQQQNILFVMSGKFENNLSDYERLRGEFKLHQLSMLKDRVDLYLSVNGFRLGRSNMAVMR